MKILDEGDVCIIGGGLVGSTIAYQLSRERKRVILLEKDFPAAGASGSTFGLIGFQWFKYDTEMPVLFIDYLKESYDLYKGMTQEIGKDFEYRVTGSLVTIETEEELEQRKKLVDFFEKQGLEIMLLNKGETLKLEPLVNPNILGSTFCPYEGEINPFKLVYYTLMRAGEYGTQIHLPVKIEGIDCQNGRIKGVFTDKGKLRTECIVNASGSGGEAIAKMVGLKIPLKMQKGQILVTEPIPPIITRQVHHLKKLKMPKGELPVPESTEIVQKANGNLFLGGTREDLPFYETKNTLQGIHTVARKAIHLIPSIKEVQIIRSFAGVRHIPVDSYPVLGESKRVKGFFNAILHAAVMMTPIVGQVISDLIIKGRSKLPIGEFSIERFQEGAA